MNYKSIKPNILYAAVLQFFQLFIYMLIFFLSYNMISFFLGFDIYLFIIDAFKSVDNIVISNIFMIIEDKLISGFVVLVFSLMLVIMNLVNKKVEIQDNKVIIKDGFIKINKQEFLFDEVKRFEIEKDFGFLNSGTIKIMTKYGDRINLDYIFNLKKAKLFLDKVVNNNQAQNINQNTDTNQQVINQNLNMPQQVNLNQNSNPNPTPDDLNK